MILQYDFCCFVGRELFGLCTGKTGGDSSSLNVDGLKRSHDSFMSGHGVTTELSLSLWNVMLNIKITTVKAQISHRNCSTCIYHQDYYQNLHSCASTLALYIIVLMPVCFWMYLHSVSNMWFGGSRLYVSDSDVGVWCDIHVGGIVWSVKAFHNHA